MKKIIFTSNVSWAMIKFRYDLIEYLISKGHEIYIIAPYDDFVPELKKLGCKCINIELSRKGINPISDLKLMINLYKIYKKLNPDIIFNYSIKPIIYGSIAAKLANIKSIAVNIGLGYTFINTNIITKISQLLYKLALYFPDEVWFINEDDKNEFIKRKIVSKGKTSVLPSEGINTEYFSPRKSLINNDKIIFLLIGRVLWDKGVGEFYEAAKIISKKYDNVEFHLLGNIDLDNPRGISLRTVEKWTDEGIINYLGYSRDVRDSISNSTCIVLPSYREGKGMTLIEAGSMGKPLIATNVEGCKDIVKDGYNGYLCKVKSSKSLADACIKFINLKKDEKKQMGKNSQKFMKKNFCVKNVIAMYQFCLDRNT